MQELIKPKVNNIAGRSDRIASPSLDRNNPEPSWPGPIAQEAFQSPFGASWHCKLPCLRGDADSAQVGDFGQEHSSRITYPQCHFGTRCGGAKSIQNNDLKWSEGTHNFFQNSLKFSRPLTDNIGLLLNPRFLYNLGGGSVWSYRPSPLPCGLS